MSSSSSLRSLSDVMHREAAEVYDAVTSKLKDTVKMVTGKTTKQTVVQLDGDRTLRSRRAAAEVKVEALYKILHKEVSTISDVQERFLHSLQNIVKCDIAEVTNATVSTLSEADCRRALPIACKMVRELTKMYGMQTVICHAYEKSDECQRKQLMRWDAEACKHAQEVDRLHAEAEATEKRMKKLATKINACTMHLTTAAKKAKNVTPINGTASLNAAISNAERTIKSEQEKTNVLEKELTDAAAQLQAMLDAYDAASGKTQNLETQLEAALDKGTALVAKCEELDEKLRCSTCMDREKNVAFACGHAYCDQCAADWDTCSLTCKRPNSDKPVKFRYPLFI